MRSRLEASFAEWLDYQGWVDGWEYEPECFASEAGQYLPDFLVHDKWGMSAYYEVKPDVSTLEETCKRMEIILDSHPASPLYMFVATPHGEWPAIRFHKSAEWHKGDWLLEGGGCLNFGLH